MRLRRDAEEAEAGQTTLPPADSVEPVRSSHILLNRPFVTQWRWRLLGRRDSTKSVDSNLSHNLFCGRGLKPQPQFVLWARTQTSATICFVGEDSNLSHNLFCGRGLKPQPQFVLWAKTQTSATICFVGEDSNLSNNLFCGRGLKPQPQFVLRAKTQTSATICFVGEDSNLSHNLFCGRGLKPQPQFFLWAKTQTSATHLFGPNSKGVDEANVLISLATVRRTASQGRAGS
ncbi:hypothetical protein GWK47_009238 [Chionoecetes opilio]|uniref:Uncharacterized protein n=1 Tax=Chionoecetes opilio TaxID=41210 RepID=A0A8J4XXS4_CHIOP|nr:hypothetical protein GWK47_009238 [Chionoecetes opilio]